MVSLRLQRATFSGRFNRPNESDDKRRIVLKGLLYMFLDITIALGVALLLYLMFVGKGISPSPRPLYCNDTGIAKPFYPNTVDLKQLLLISLATPFLVICTVEALLFYNAEASQFMYRCIQFINLQGNHRLAKFFTTSTLVYLQYVIVYAVGTFAMEIIKCRVGRLRPHFLAACRPDWSKMDCKTDPNSVIPPEEVICLNPDFRRIRTARASFPSGHTAAAALCWLFMSIYLIRMASATRNRYVIWMRNVLITIFTIWTFFVAVTRVTDYWHHPTDVLGGFVLAISCVFPPFLSSWKTESEVYNPRRVEMNLQEAKTKFIELLDNVDPAKKSAFLRYVTTFSDVKRSKLAIDAEEKLQRISDSLREQLPTCAILDSENVLYPQVGFDSEHNSQNTVNVDCFLYNDDAVEDLISHGKMSRNYCLDCGSKNTKPLLFISHSLSVPQIEFIFTKLIPLDKDSLPADFHVLDIGSRIGSIVFGAALFSNGRAKVTGVEMNEKWCAIQEKIINTNEYLISNVSIVCSDIRARPDLLASANIIVMNNVFSFFLSVEEQENCWKVLHSFIKEDTLIVHNPSIHEVTAHLNLTFEIDDWLQEEDIVTKCADFAGVDEELFEDCSSLHLYRVKASK